MVINFQHSSIIIVLPFKILRFHHNVPWWQLQSCRIKPLEYAKQSNKIRLGKLFNGALGQAAEKISYATHYIYAKLE